MPAVDRSDPRVVVLLGDSVLGGGAGSAPSLRRAMKLLNWDARIEVFAAPFRTVADALAEIDKIVELRPDVVCVAHGGTEAVESGPLLGARFSRDDAAAPVQQPPGRITTWTRRFRVTAWARRRARLIVQRRRKGPRMPWETFEAMYRDLVSALLAGTSASVVLIDLCGGDRQFVPHDPVWLRSLTELIKEIACALPERVVAVQPATVLRQWEDFAADRAHLGVSGHRAVGEELARALQSLRRRSLMLREPVRQSDAQDA